MSLLYTRLTLRPPAWLFVICLPVCLPGYHSVCLSAWLSLCLSVCLSGYHSTCLPACLAITLPVCLPEPKSEDEFDSDEGSVLGLDELSLADETDETAAAAEANALADPSSAATLERMVTVGEGGFDEQYELGLAKQANGLPLLVLM